MHISLHVCHSANTKMGFLGAESKHLPGYRSDLQFLLTAVLAQAVQEAKH